MAITTTDIVTQFGSYYTKGQNNASRLFAKLTAPSETLAIAGIRHLTTDETVYEAANVAQTEVIQAYQHGFTAKGNTTFTPNVIPLHKMKVDLQFAPDAIEDNWLGFLAGDSQQLKEWPIVRYILEELVAGKIAEDRELNMVYKGVRVAPTTGTASTAASAMNGFKAIIRAAANASYPIHSVAGIGALTNADIFDQIEAFEDAIPGYLKSRRMVIFVAPEMATAYFRKLRALGYYDVASASGLSMKVDQTNHEIVGVPSMSGTTDIWATTPENILHIVKRSDEAGNFDIQADKRDVNVLGHWYEGVGFENNDLVYASAVSTVADAAANSNNPE
ncbi:MAG: hypothetical protein IJU19_09155 [Bacteroidales bacterium]|nr:hypothetical protein [Bacteroidales bacterium]